MDNNENIHNRFDTNEYKGKEQSRLAVTKTYLEIKQNLSMLDQFDTNKKIERYA